MGLICPFDDHSQRPSASVSAATGFRSLQDIHQPGGCGVKGSAGWYPRAVVRRCVISTSAVAARAGRALVTVQKGCRAFAGDAARARRPVRLSSIAVTRRGPDGSSPGVDAPEQCGPRRRPGSVKWNGAGIWAPQTSVPRSSRLSVYSRSSMANARLRESDADGSCSS